MGISAFGTLLKIGDGATPTENFTTIAEVTDITGPSFKMKLLDATNHSSPGGFEQVIPGTIAPGEVKLSVNFIPTNSTQSQSTGLLRDYKNRTLRDFQLVFPDTGATTWSFTAYVSSFDLKAPANGKLSADFTLSISGATTMAG